MANNRSNSTPIELIAGAEPQTSEDYIERGWRHYSKKEFYRAEADFRKALEMNADPIDTLYALGMTLQASGRPPEAIQAFEKVIELLQTAAPADNARTLMLSRLSHGHINRMKTGDWNLAS